jgi:methyl-accepting chemotaxis protein
VLKRVKLGPKLIGAFVVVALIGGLIGSVGYGGSKKLDGHITELGDMELQRIMAGQDLRIGLRGALLGERALINPLMAAPKVREAQYKAQDADLGRGEEAIAKYDAIPRNDEQDKAWKEARGSWDAWRVKQNAVMETCREKDRLIAAGVQASDPRMLAMDQKCLAASMDARDLWLVAYNALDDMVDRDFEEACATVKTAQADSKRTQSMVLMTILIGVLVAVALGVVLSRGITLPMTAMADTAAKLAEGQMNQKITYESGDEIGRLAQAFRDLIANLRDVIGNVMEATEKVAEGSATVSASAEQLSSGSTEQAANVEEVSSSMEEMNSSVLQNAENATQTTQIAAKSANEAVEGGQAVGETVEAMKNIAEKINIIEEIARQTNMLALNAAIEAARAGDAGKGFAVVAAEVRKLAERSGNAAQEISTLSSNSVQVAEKAGRLLTDIVPGIQRTADLVQEINASSDEQARGVAQITEAIHQLDSVIQQNASASEELAATSQELAGQSDDLQEAVGFFKFGDERRHHSHGAAAQRSRPTLAPGRPQAPSVADDGVLLQLHDDDMDGDFERQSA